MNASSRSLKTAQSHISRHDKRRLKTGITGSFTGVRQQATATLDLITVKIVRAHGGCLGTKSRRRA